MMNGKVDRGIRNGGARGLRKDEPGQALTEAAINQSEIRLAETKPRPKQPLANAIVHYLEGYKHGV